MSEMTDAEKVRPFFEPQYAGKAEERFERFGHPDFRS